MDAAQREALREEVTQARGQFGAWHAGLLRLDPDLLRRTHEFVLAAEAGCTLPEELQHLIWLATDAVPTHLYPRGIGIHARRAIEAGATVGQVFEALEIACARSGVSLQTGLPIVEAALREAGLAPLPPGPADAAAQASRERHDERSGPLPAILEAVFGVEPAYVGRLLELAYAPQRTPELDPCSRALIFFGVAACPAILDRAEMQHYARRAIVLGADGRDLVSVLRLVGGIGIHALSVGVPAVIDAVPELGEGA